MLAAREVWLALIPVSTSMLRRRTEVRVACRPDKFSISCYLHGSRNFVPRFHFLWLIFLGFGHGENLSFASLRQLRTANCLLHAGAAKELFGSLFQETTFLRLDSFDFRNPDRQVAEYWYCSDHCARDHLDCQINGKEELRSSKLRGDQLAFGFFYAA